MKDTPGFRGLDHLSFEGMYYECRTASNSCREMPHWESHGKSVHFRVMGKQIQGKQSGPMAQHMDKTVELGTRVDTRAR